MEIQNFFYPDLKALLTIWPSDATDEHPGFEYLVSVLWVNDIELQLQLDSAFDMNPLLGLEPGMLVALQRLDEAFLIYPTFDHIEGQDLWLRHDETTEFKLLERRGFARIYHAIPITITDPDKRSAKIVNLSGNGMRIVSSMPLQPNAPIWFSGIFANETLQLNAVPIYCIENTGNRHEGEAYVSGVRFLNLTDAQQTKIMKECFRRQLGQQKLNFR